MKYIPTLSLTTMLLAGCAYEQTSLAPLSSVRPSVAKEGTLANASLITDTTTAIYKIVGAQDEGKPMPKFVIQKPVGAVGNKAWREIWVYDPAKTQQQFVITFKEDGKGSADFEIQKR